MGGVLLAQVGGERRRAAHRDRQESRDGSHRDGNGARRTQSRRDPVRRRGRPRRTGRSRRRRNPRYRHVRDRLHRRRQDDNDAGGPAREDPMSHGIPRNSSATRGVLVLAAIVVAMSGTTPAGSQSPRILWGDEVPPNWTGTWPAELRAGAEQSKFTRTLSSLQLLEYFALLKGKSENVHVVNMFTSPRGKVAPAMVLAAPRVTSAQQARASG